MPIAASAGIDTNIHFYDLNKLEIRSKVTPSEYGGYTTVKFSQIYSHVLYAASTLGDLTAIDMRNGEVIKTFKGH
jgi:WD40 repeat protein